MCPVRPLLYIPCRKIISLFFRLFCSNIEQKSWEPLIYTELLTSGRKICFAIIFIKSIPLFEKVMNTFYLFYAQKGICKHENIFIDGFYESHLIINKKKCFNILATSFFFRIRMKCILFGYYWLMGYSQ